MKILLLALAFVSLSVAQDNSSADRTIPFSVRSDLPGTCKIGQVLTRKDLTPGSNVYICGSTNNWVLLGGGVDLSGVPANAVLEKSSGAVGGNANLSFIDDPLNTGAKELRLGQPITDFPPPSNYAGFTTFNLVVGPSTGAFFGGDTALHIISTELATGSAQLNLLQSGGTPASPVSLLSGNGAGQIGFGGYLSTSASKKWNFYSDIVGQIDGAPSANYLPVSLTFESCCDSSGNGGAWMSQRINGNIDIGTNYTGNVSIRSDTSNVLEVNNGTPGQLATVKALGVVHTPVTSSEACKAGQSSTDATFYYVCTATNTWKRAALSSF